MSDPKTSQEGSSRLRSRKQAAEDELAACLEAYDRGGDQELQKELERIHSEKTPLRVEKIMGSSRAVF